MTSKNLGKRIKQRREHRGLTQTELAKRAGLSRIYIAKLEAGERQSPSLPVLERIAKALGVKLVDLLQ
jgi:transcriptional regulator with XRE-family HTH domain